MAKNFVRIGAWPAAPALARDLIPLLQAHKREMGYDLGVNSIYRTKSEQAAIFTSRYRRGAYSPYGDYRTYQGVTWGRTSGLGPVASPDVGSNHTRGYAVDFAISAISPSFTWLRNNAHRFNFNHTEGASIREPWHWVWKIGIFPGPGAPDPWEGRGAPDPVYPGDEGITVNGNSGAGGSGSVDDLEDDVSQAKLDKIIDQLGGSDARQTSLRQDVDKLLRQVGGSDTRKTSLREDVDDVLRRVQKIEKVIGSTEARAAKGDTLGVRLDKIIKHLSGKKPL